MVERRASIPAETARDAAEQAAAILGRRPDVRLVYVYGSAADAGQRTVRDVDLAVLTDQPLRVEEIVRLRAHLVQTLQLDVDLVSLNEATIVLAHEVVEAGRCLYARTADLETEFVTRARSRYWDFAPFRAEQWRLLGERLEERRRGA